MNKKEQELVLQMAGLAKELAICQSTFLALGDQNRQQIIITLLENYGGMRVGELAKISNLSRPAVSHHLKILKDAGIINMFKKGTMNFYHMEADEQKWRQIAALMNNIHGLVKGFADNISAGIISCGNEDF